MVLRGEPVPFSLQFQRQNIVHEKVHHLLLRRESGKMHQPEALEVENRKDQSTLTRHLTLHD